MAGRRRGTLTPAEPAYGEGDEEDEEADLKQEADERGDAAEPAGEAAAQERTEQARAEEGMVRALAISELAGVLADELEERGGTRLLREVELPLVGVLARQN